MITPVDPREALAKAKEVGYAAVWAGHDFFTDRGDYQSAVDNGFIWRNVERALDAVLASYRPAHEVAAECAQIAWDIAQHHFDKKEMHVAFGAERVREGIADAFPVLPVTVTPEEPK